MGIRTYLGTYFFEMYCKEVDIGTDPNHRNVDTCGHNTTHRQRDTPHYINVKSFYITTAS